MTRRYDVCVMGAGVVGVSTAYFLAKAGKSVVLVDRLPGPGLDTSFANGGQISVCHAEPWATPSAPLKVAKWLMRDDAPLLFRPRFDPWQWLWLLGWMVECLPRRTERNTLAILELALHSRQVLRSIREAEGLVYDYGGNGIVQFFRDAKTADAAGASVDLLRQHGCALDLIDRRRVLELEPALNGPVADHITGGTFSPGDESGDAHKFTIELAGICARMGVEFLYNHEITGLPHDRGARHVRSVRTRDLTTSLYREIEAAQYVVALGAFSAPLLRPLGVWLNIYPTKGYSLTIPVGDAAVAPTRSVTDEKYKMVFTRLGDRLRVAGTAELDAYSRDLSRVRCDAMLKHTSDVFPSAGDFAQGQFWTGLRPSTPSNLPYLGPSVYSNLYLNTGHGTLGWTMGPGSGERLAARMSGR
jgi:D-amino-acid dehydrogenase